MYFWQHGVAESSRTSNSDLAGHSGSREVTLYPSTFVFRWQQHSLPPACSSRYVGRVCGKKAWREQGIGGDGPAHRAISGGENRKGEAWATPPQNMLRNLRPQAASYGFFASWFSSRTAAWIRRCSGGGNKQSSV